MSKRRLRSRFGGKVAGLATGAAVSIATALALGGSPAQAATLSPAAPAHTAAAATTPATLKLGSRGAAVLALQHRLWGLHYWVGNINGVFGYDTQQAVYAFQTINHLTEDGVVGPKTQYALAHPHTYAPNDASKAATRIEVNISHGAQVLLLYKNHNLVLIAHISSAGGYTYYDPGSSVPHVAITPTGTYRANWFDPGWVTVPLGKMYNPVFFIGGEFAIHGDTAVPNYPASHGCIRISDDLASVFHTMITVSYSNGTPIYIYNRARTY